MRVNLSDLTALVGHVGMRTRTLRVGLWIPAPAFAGVTFFRRNDGEKERE